MTADTMYIADSRRLTNAGAKKMIEAATAKAAERGAAVTVAVVDAGGHLILLERMEGGKFHTVYSATTKAACAASTRRVTTSQGAVGQPLDTAHALGLALAAGAERWTAMEGGCPVLVNGECLGGVGVAGADWKTDEMLAQDAVTAIGASWA
jgi:glc operon protein GlcG